MGKARATVCEFAFFSGEVTVTGQFETGYDGYGHMGAYSHQLILMDVRPTVD
jgi:hypothetical protein